MIKSLHKNRIGILLMAIAALLVSLGQMFWKMGTNNGIWFILIGFVIYAIGASLLILAFRFGDVSVLHPFLSLNYVFVLYIGYVVLNEEIFLLRIIGVIIIMVGVVLVGGSNRE